MGKLLVLLLIIVPALEVGILVLAGNSLGVIPTVLLIITTGLIGAWLAKREGTQVLRTAQLQMQNGEVPSGLVLDGICILVGGVLLLTPGFLTDLLGFILIIPYTRATMKGLFQKIFERLVKNGNVVISRRR
ncbi:FxsA family protein [Alteribacillus sp. HJP-4]|uniref:FxsA family protein n=1 Tax=Alteribacillus sp. HJP-4 TaxID=2775394 RepID=UPI0035CD37E1